MIGMRQNWPCWQWISWVCYEFILRIMIIATIWLSTKSILDLSQYNVRCTQICLVIFKSNVNLVIIASCISKLSLLCHGAPKRWKSNDESKKDLNIWKIYKNNIIYQNLFILFASVYGFRIKRLIKWFNNITDHTRVQY